MNRFVSLCRANKLAFVIAAVGDVVIVSLLVYIFI